MCFTLCFKSATILAHSRSGCLSTLQALYPPFSVGLGLRPGAAEPAVTEVHLRRLDRDGMLHRRAVAVISIDASPEQVSGASTGSVRRCLVL